MVESISFCRVFLSRFSIIYACFLFIFIAMGSKGASRGNTNAPPKAKPVGSSTLTLPLQYSPYQDFLVTMGLGTPAQNQTFALVTSLTTSWIQCQPSWLYYPQMDPVFDPSLSNSYSSVPCSSPLCASSPGSSFRSTFTKKTTSFCVGCWGTTCGYMYQDGDNSNIIGELSMDVLSPTKKEAVTGFVFGCGRINNIGYFSNVSGYFGLGTGAQGFLHATASKYKQRFSYCLPQNENSTGFLSFGGFVSKSVKFVAFSKSVPFVIYNNDPTYYFVDLVGISVGGRRLPIALSISDPFPTLVATGNVITRLPSDVYTALRDEFRRRMSKYPVLAREEFAPDFDTCYNLSEVKNALLPAIEFTFGDGVVLPLSSSGILYVWNSTVSCFAFSSSGGGSYGIFGTAHQSPYEVIFDNPNSRIGFGNGCSS